MTQTADVTSALDRIRATVAARTAAAPPMAVPIPPVQPPAEPVAPPQDAGAQDQRISDLEDAIAALGDRVAALEGAGIEDAMNSLSDWGPDMPMMAALPETHTAATFTQAERDAMAKSGVAMPDGGYPIRNQADLQNAVQAMGRATNPDAVKAHIRKRAQAMNMMGWLKKHAPSVVGS